ncbi:MAG: FtsX-like permease family protein [Microbacterium gubbeenense]
MSIRRLVRGDAIAAVFTLATVAIASVVAGLGAVLAAQVVTSSTALLDEGRAPDLAQMHAGEVDPDAIAQFAATDPSVTGFELAELVAIDSAALQLTPGAIEAASTIEYFAVSQSETMNHLLDADGGLAEVSPGGIGIPIDLALERGIELGDTIAIGQAPADSTPSAPATFTVESLIRDPTMNGSLSSSRRLLVDEADLPAIREAGTGSEWLIQFDLTDPAEATAVTDRYYAANLPANGPALDLASFRLLAGLTDGLVAAAVLVVAALLAAIAALTLSIAVRTSVSAQLRQIGMLRAIGLPRSRIRGITLGGQLAVIAAGAGVGGGAALALAPLATAAIRMRLGGDVTPLAAVGVVAVALATIAVGWLIAWMALLPAMRRSPSEVMRQIEPAGRLRGPRRQAGRARATRAAAPSRGAHAWWLLARLALRRTRGDSVALGSVLAAALLMTVLPVSLHATITSPSFPAATGIAVSDLRIDLRTTDADAPGDITGTASSSAPGERRLDTLEAALGADDDIAATTTLRSVRVPALQADGTWGGLNVEAGDHTAFPLQYHAGSPPTAEHELALSELSAAELEAGVGDAVTLDLAGDDVAYTVVGVYRDITSGGKTAKVAPDEALLAAGTPLWTVVLADLGEHADREAVIGRYAELAAPARVTDVDTATSDVFGGIIGAMRALSIITAAVAAGVVGLVTAMLVRLFLARSARTRAVSQAIGAPHSSARAAMLTRALIPGLAGVAAGAALGPVMAGALLSAAGAMVGASGLTLTISPVLGFVALPALLGGTAAAIAWFGTSRVPRARIARIVAGGDT